MKKFTQFSMLTLLFSLFSIQINAQDGYTYTLIDNGSYSYTISAVPNMSSSNFATSVQSYGFTIILPDGVTANITSSLGSSAGATPFDGSQVGMPAIDGILITETLAAPINLAELPSSGIPTPMVTIQVNGSPTSGTIEILANNSPLATTITALKCFMSADMVDDGMATYPPVVDAVGPGLSGTTMYSFSTLGLEETTLAEYSIYPNPAKTHINIKGLEHNLSKVEIYSITGQRVIANTNNLETINVSALQNGVYFVKVRTETSNKTIKFIKE